MLQKETVDSETLELLKVLMVDERLKNFILVGGTALSLQIGHRHSIGLDLITQDVFNPMDLLAYLTERYCFQSTSISNATILGKFNHVKTDFIRHHYKNVKPVIECENIRLASLEDISAMKLNAIVQNGSRLKDFIDIAFLSYYLPLNEMVDNYITKYEIVNSIMAIKGIAFHDDINFSEAVFLMGKDLDWRKIEKRIAEMLKYPQKIFDPF